MGIMETDIKDIIKDDSPWHSLDVHWYEKDGSLRPLMEAKDAGLFEPPKLCFILKRDFFQKLIDDKDNYGLIILRGPRRIGKTSTLKYITYELIEEKSIDPHSIVYLSLDKDELLVKDGKKRFMRELIKEIIDKYKKKDKPLIIILDEVTFYEGWARSLKNIIDEGLLRPGIGIIATGSYSLDLSSAKRELSGRWGPLGDSFGGDVFYYPRRFIEVAESIMDPGFNTFIQRNFGRFSRRIGMIEYLAGFQTEDDDERYGYSEILKKLMDTYYQDLHELFYNVFLYTGGYPKTLYESAVSKRNTGKVSIEDARYRDEIYNLLTTDSKKFKLSEKIVEEILKKINWPSLEIGPDFNVQGLNKSDMKHYIKYLNESGLFAFLPRISKEQIDLENKSVSSRTEFFKLIVSDPAAFIATYQCSRGVKYGILDKAKKTIDEKDHIKDLLFESILCAHLGKSPVLGQPFVKDTIGYIKDEDEELADCFVWHINYHDEMILIATEAKSGDLDESALKAKAIKLKKRFGIKKLIVVADCDTITQKEEYTILPMEIFLLFL